MQFYNIHAHIFTMWNAPEKFLELYLPRPVAKAVDKITNTKVGAWAMQKILSFFKRTRRYAAFLKIGKSRNQGEVFRDLMERYTDDTSMKIVALTLNMEQIGAGRSFTGFEGQIEEALVVKKRFPEKLLLFFCIDPRWLATGEEIKDKVVAYFETKIESGGKTYFPFAGLKIYPSTGFYGFDEKLKPVLEWAATNKVPVLTHCSYLGGLYNNDINFLKANLNAYDPYAQKIYSDPCYCSDQKRIRTNNQNTCSYFLEPWSFKSMLEHFDEKGTPLKLCFAHFGGEEHIKLQHTSVDGKPFYGTQKDRNWTSQIIEIMTKHESVYTDISYALSKTETHDFIFKQLEQGYGKRILFGTDFFMTERVAPEENTYRQFKSKALQKNINGRNAWEILANSNAETFLESPYFQKV